MNTMLTFALNVGGLNLQSSGAIMPSRGVLVAIDWAASFAAVTTGAEFVGAVTSTQFSSAADFDANLDGKRTIISVIRQRIGFVTSGLSGFAINKFCVCQVPVAAGMTLYLQTNSATNAIVCSVILHVMV